MRSCAVCKKRICKQNGHFFCVPKCEIRRQKWSEICKVNLTQNSRLCIEHFSRAQVITTGRRRLLMPNAEPVMQNHRDDPLAGLPNAYEPLINSEYRALLDKPLQEYPEAAELPTEIENDNIGLSQEQQTQTGPPISHDDYPNKINKLELGNKELKSELAPANSVVDSMPKIFTDGQISKLMGPDDLCRICATTIKEEKALGLFENENNILLLKIKDLTGVQLINETGLPKLICLDCNNDILEAYKKFREDFLKVQASFKLHVRANKQQNGNRLIKEREFVKKFDFEEETNISISDYEPILEEEKEINEILSFEDTNGFGHNSCDGNALKDTKNAVEDNNETKLECNIDKIDAFSDLEVKEIGESDEEWCEPIKELEDSKVFVCDQCGYQVNSRNSLKIHLKRHSGVKQYVCAFCPHKFVTNGERHRHMRKHTGEKPYPCRFCSRRYTDGSQRLKHERTHTNERPYVCHLCGKAFTVSNILKNHMLMHTGEKVFKCDLCNRKFGRKTNLDVHFTTKMHKEAVEWDKLGLQFPDSRTRIKCKTEKPYVCSVCDRSFKQSNTLKNHMLTHTGVKDFKCDACNKSFARKCQLDAHFTTNIHKQSVENTELLEFLEFQE